MELEYTTSDRINLRDILRKRDEAPHEPAVIAVKIANPEPYWEKAEIDVREVLTAAYQREIREYKVRRILREGWKPLKAGAIYISCRADGTYYVIDGQHRIVAIARMNGTAPYRQPVVLWFNLTPEQEAEMFSGMQDSDTRTPLLPDEMHNARRHESDESEDKRVAVLIDEVLGRHGFHFGSSAPTESSRRLHAVKSVYKTERTYGADILDAALHTITAAWGTGTAPEASLVDGMATFVVLFPDANFPNLIKRLKKTHMKHWVDDADRAGHALKIRQKNERILRHLHAEYNTTHHRNSLPDWDTELKGLKARRKTETDRVNLSMPRIGKST